MNPDRPMLDSLELTLGVLRSLEEELHTPAARRDRPRLDALLHPEFVEFGRSGRRYSKADILEKLPAETDVANTFAAHFALRMLSPGIALLTYRSAHVQPSGLLERHTLRTSIWEVTELGWQLSFHQGTPMEANNPEA